VSSWEPYRLAIELTTAIDAAAATLWLEPQVSDPREMLVRGFQRMFGKTAGRAAAEVALACDAYPFGGYPRWEINERWDAVSRREAIAPYRAEERYFARLAERARRRHLALPLRASVRFRHYLAARDVLVRQAAQSRRVDLRKFEGILKVGRHAARIMWKRTRDRRGAGPNEAIVSADATRLRAWRRGKHVFGGEWQLCYRVWNFAPAAQLVGIEQQQADGSWKRLQACHTIEFQTGAAQPRSDIVREHAAPVNWDGDLAAPPRLRAFVRGVGEVKIGEIELVSRGRRLRAYGFGRGRWVRLGKPAPQRGWPDLEQSDERGLEWPSEILSGVSDPGYKLFETL
jgi:hypothetical protein